MARGKRNDEAHSGADQLGSHLLRGREAGDVGLLDPREGVQAAIEDGHRLRPEWRQRATRCRIEH
jgi:hypothetical protein